MEMSIGGSGKYLVGHLEEKQEQGKLPRFRSSQESEGTEMSVHPKVEFDIPVL